MWSGSSLTLALWLGPGVWEASCCLWSHSLGGHLSSSQEQESKPGRGDAPVIPALGIRDTWVCKSEASMVLRVSSGIPVLRRENSVLNPTSPPPQKKKAALTKLCQNRQCLCFVLTKTWVGFIAMASGPALGLRVEARSFVLDTHPELCLWPLLLILRQLHWVTPVGLAS